MGGQVENQIETVSLLLPVWGLQFTRRFLDFCLPTLLSPNNIPALARHLPCRFVLLSSENDEQVIVEHPAWRRLKEFCAVEILLIDDLITGRNHSATITLGFERALRQTGQAMRRTCFIFLMSDYLVADGSLSTVLAALQRGARAVLVGNFQIVAEDTTAFLQQSFDPLSSEIVLGPRDLMRFALRHLHPATVANTVNVGLTHNAHCNRLFWSVDHSTLIGRFYLMHPIAICPEVDDFEVGSSWDYSFIPELCPSGQIATLADSDDYLVVEMQRRFYEHEHLRAGPLDARALATSLSEWTTARHRANVEQKLIFHADELPAELSEVAAQSDAFISGIRKMLVGPTQPHRHHPYWIGSLAAHRRDARRPLDGEDWKFVLLNREPPLGWLPGLLQDLEEKLLWYPPDVTKLHPGWPDYRTAAEFLRSMLDSKRRVLLITEEPAKFARWISRKAGPISMLSAVNLLQMPPSLYKSLLGTFEGILFILSEEAFEWCDTLLAFAAPLVVRGGTCGLLFLNARQFDNASEFGRTFAREAARLWQPGVRLEDVQYTKCGPLRWHIRERLGELRSRVAVGSAVASYSALVSCAFLPFVYLVNRMVKWQTHPIGGAWSSVFVSMHVSEPGGDDVRLLANKRNNAVRRVELSDQENGRGFPTDRHDQKSGLRTVNTPSFNSNLPISESYVSFGG